MKASLLLLFVSISAINFAQDNDVLKNKYTALLEPYMEDFPDGSELAFAYVSGDKYMTLGLKRKKDKNVEVQNQNKAFEVGEITRVFTAAILAHYVVEGKVNLDDVVKDRISIELKKKFTFKQLANHTSGLDRRPTNQMTRGWSSTNPWKDYNEQLLREYLDAKFKVVNKPGVEYFESDIGQALLGFALKRIEQIKLEDLVDIHIFKKFGMNSSSMRYDDIKDSLITPIDGIGQKTDNWTFQRSISAIGGLYTTAEDMARFISQHFQSSNEFLLLGAEPTARIGGAKEIGLGWEVHHDIAGHPVLFIDGRTGGFTSCLIVDLTKKKGFILLSNQVLGETSKTLIEIAKKDLK